jgi:hypothetical protein
VTKIHTPKNHSTKESFFKKLNATKLKSKSQCGEKSFFLGGILVIFPEK